MKDFRIIQYSEPRTGSTLLANVLYGFFAPESAVKFCPGAFTWSLILKNSPSLGSKMGSKFVTRVAQGRVFFSIMLDAF